MSSACNLSEALASATQGGTAELVHSLDWATTPLGPMSSWPRALRAVVDMLLAQPVPMLVLWGPEHIQIYNDGYARIAGARHPSALGRSAHECCPEGALISPSIHDAVLERGESLVLEDQRFQLERGAGQEDASFTLSYSPLRDDDGHIAGIFVTVIETTSKIVSLGERRAQQTKRMNEKLRENAERWRETFERFPEGFILGEVVYDDEGRGVDWRYLEMNAAWESLTGFKRDETAGRTIREVQPNIEQEWIDRIVEVADSGEATSFVEYVSERRRWYEAHVFRPEPGRFAVFFKDVTKRRNAEDALRASERRLAEVFRWAPSFMVILQGPDHVIELANDRYYQLVGHRDIVGKPAREALPEVEGQGFFELIDNVYRTGETWAGQDLPVLLQRKPGDAPEERLIDLVYQPIRGADGTVTGVFAQGVDITERKLAEAAIREREEQLRQLADSMPQIVWTSRADGTVEYFNRRWYEYTGLPDDGITGEERWAEVHEPEGLSRVHEVWGESIRTGKPYEIEYRLRRHDGEFRWHLGRAIPVRDEAGRVVRWFGTNTDIHDQKELQSRVEELLEAERHARSEEERASRLKDEFLATLSHELRTPLNAILGWSQILRRGRMDDPKTVGHGLDIIERNARAQSQLIGDLLDMSSIISGKVRLSVQRIPLSEIVGAALASVQPAAAAKEIALERIIDSNAGSIWGDPDRLQQVFWNLLTNAIKFTPKGGKITVELARVESQIKVRVTDTGKGMKAEFLPHAFDRFRQADASTTRVHGGLGLGLSIVKNLLELHGGSVGVASEGEGKGSTFTVWLPSSPVHESEVQGGADARGAEAGRSAGKSAAGVLAGVKVLVVDDEADARDLARHVLSGAGAEVWTAGSAGEALVIVNEVRPDVLLSDIGMPQEDGYSLIRKVRSLDQATGGRIPAAALTAFARTEDRARALQAGFQNHLAKPVDPDELLFAVASLVGRNERIKMAG